MVRKKEEKASETAEKKQKKARKMKETAEERAKKNKEKTNEGPKRTEEDCTHRAGSKRSIPSSLAATSASKRSNIPKKLIPIAVVCVLAHSMMMHWLRLERAEYTVCVDVGSMRVAWRK